MKQKFFLMLALLTFCLVQNPAQAQGIFTPEEILSKYSSDPNSVVGLIMKVKFTGTSSTNWEVKSGSNTIAFRKDDNPDLNANTEYVALTTFTAIEGQPGWYKAKGNQDGIKHRGHRTHHPKPKNPSRPAIGTTSQRLSSLWIHRSYTPSPSMERREPMSSSRPVYCSTVPQPTNGVSLCVNSTALDTEQAAIYLKE